MRGDDQKKTDIFVEENELEIKKLDAASHYKFTITPMFSTVGDPTPSLEGSSAELAGTTIPATPLMPHQLNISLHEVTKV
jgi:hypothetical protein